MYDAIVVGARCAGSPTAMLLARRGFRVLLVDRASFPSDTVSTHYIHQSGVAHLQQWRLLDRVRASGSPPIIDTAFDLQGIEFIARPPPAGGVHEAFGPRRTVLDAILVEAAADAGAEVREGFTVKDVVWDDGRVVGVEGRAHGGATATERARLVIGADGLRSVVARAVGAPRYEEHSPRTHTYYSYWTGGPQRQEFYGAPGVGAAGFPTTDGLAMVACGWSAFEYPAGVTSDLEGNYLSALRRFPRLADSLEGAERVGRISGMANIPNFFRRSSGPGWALVGDAGYHKDPTAAQGMTDAFRDAELVVAAVDQALSGDDATVDAALAEYVRRRDDAAIPFFRWALRFARLDAFTPPMRELFTAIAADQDWANRFAGLNAETVNPDEFFATPSTGGGGGS